METMENYLRLTINFEMQHFGDSGGKIISYLNCGKIIWNISKLFDSNKDEIQLCQKQKCNIINQKRKM